MSPTTHGSTTAVQGRAGIELPTARRQVDDDPWERLEKARSARRIQSPIHLKPRPETTRHAPRAASRETRTPRSTTPRSPSRDAPEMQQQIKTLAGQGKTSTEIAHQLHIAIGTVRRHARAAGIVLPRSQDRPGWDIDTAKRLASQGLPIRDIAAEVGVSHDTVRKALRTAGVSVAPRTDERAAAVIGLHTNGEDLSPPQIAQRLGTTPATVRRILDRHGIPRSDARATRSGGASRITPPPVDELTRLYEEHGSAINLARHLGIGHTTVLRMLKAAGIPIKTSGQVQKGRPGHDGGARDIATQMTAAGATAKSVRTWARAQGMNVAAVGLPSRQIWQAYLEAHPSTPTRRSSH